MPITTISPSTPQAVNPVTANQPVQDFSGHLLHGRDVVLINPFCEGGGDHALANRIANIALEEGCRVTLMPINADRNRPDDSRMLNVSLRDDGFDIGNLNNPLFIVAPVGILKCRKLFETLNRLCEQYQLPKNDIALIEEMDLEAAPDQQLADREVLLKCMGFRNVSAFNLGFGKGAIGYFPVDALTADTIKTRFEGELAKLLDSCNVSLAKDSRYHLAYISSETQITGTQLFIANTLTENKGDGKDANYIMVLRQLDGYTKKQLPEKIRYILNVQNQKNDFPALFAKATIYFADPDTGHLQETLDITGEGQGNINIVFVNALPQNIFHDFICLAHSGMASGDQSLSEFLSLTGKMPYYDMQPWKEPLAAAVVKTAEELGGEELKQAMQDKIIGRHPFSQEIVCHLTPNKEQPERSTELKNGLTALDQQISTRTADHYIRALVTPQQSS